jgi:hypothetical protein
MAKARQGQSQVFTILVEPNSTGQLTQVRAISPVTNDDQHFALNQRRRTEMKAKSGGGSAMNKNTSPPVRTGSGSKGSSPGAAGQIGASTAFRKDQVDAQRGYNPTKYGNEVALNSKSAPGQGRQIHPCGSQGTHGATVAGNSPQPKDILSSYGPDRRNG